MVDTAFTCVLRGRVYVDLIWQTQYLEPSDS